MVWFLMLVACNENPNEKSFGGGGVRVVPEYTDTGGGDDSGDSGGSASGPVIEDLALYFDEIPNIGYIIAGEVTYSDNPDDMAGGKLIFDLVEGSGSPSTKRLSVVNEEDLDATKEQAYIDGNTGLIKFGIANVDIETDYTFDAVSLVDKSGNQSEETAGTVAAGSFSG
jgi:hypothetical protein